MRKKLFLACLFCSALAFLASCQKMSRSHNTQTAKEVTPYAAKDFSHLIGMKGFSDNLLQNHFKLYQGYVKNTNALLDQLRSLLKSQKTTSLEYSELKRRLGFEFNGMRLHEYYFENLGGTKPLDAKTSLYSAIEQNFGSVAQWQQDFIATGKMRGTGWVILYADTQTGHLVNFWITDHEINHPSGCKPLLVMDVWEHAYMLDYQLDRAKYMDAFLNNVDWDAVGKRYQQLSITATVANPEQLHDSSSESLSLFKKLPES